GSLEVHAQTLISEDDLDVVRDALEPGTSAALIVYEETWAREIGGAVRNAGGEVALHVQVPRETVEAALAAAQAHADTTEGDRRAITGGRTAGAAGAGGPYRRYRGNCDRDRQRLQPPRGRTYPAGARGIAGRRTRRWERSGREADRAGRAA